MGNRIRPPKGLPRIKVNIFGKDRRINIPRIKMTDARLRTYLETSLPDLPKLEFPKVPAGIDVIGYTQVIRDGAAEYRKNGGTIRAGRFRRMANFLGGFLRRGKREKLRDLFKKEGMDAVDSLLDSEIGERGSEREERVTPGKDNVSSERRAAWKNVRGLYESGNEAEAITLLKSTAEDVVGIMIHTVVGDPYRGTFGKVPSYIAVPIFRSLEPYLLVSKHGDPQFSFLPGFRALAQSSVQLRNEKKTVIPVDKVGAVRPTQIEPVDITIDRIGSAVALSYLVPREANKYFEALLRINPGNKVENVTAKIEALTRFNYDALRQTEGWGKSKRRRIQTEKLEAMELVRGYLRHGLPTVRESAITALGKLKANFRDSLENNPGELSIATTPAEAGTMCLAPPDAENGVSLPPPETE